MVSPTKDQQTEESSASEDDLDNDITDEGTSTSQTSEKELSTFDVVMNVLNESEDDKSDEEDADSEKDKSDAPEGEESKDEKTKGVEDESGDPTEDELKLWKPKTRKRFENLQAKYRDEKIRADTNEADAGYYRNFVDFLETNGLNQEEANRLFSIGALMKNDPFAALEALTPYYHQLLEVTGQILPSDLQAQVNAGYLTQAHALEISRGRAQGRVAPAVAQDQQQRQRQRESRQQGQNVVTMQNAVAKWEQDWSKSDPDYASKKGRVLDRLELMLARAARENKLPQNTEQAIALANKARRDVEADLRQSKPRKPVSMVDGGNLGTSQLPEAKTTLDVVKRTLNR